MNHRKKVLIISLLSFLGFIVAVILTSPSSFGLCPQTDRFCFDPYDEAIGQPLGLFSLTVFFLSLILFFLREEVFHFWKKFAIVYLSFVAIILFATAGESGGGGIGVVSLDSEIISWWLAIVFLAVSTGIIAYKAWQERRQRNEMPQ